MKAMSLQDVIDLHTEIFGVEPIITGLGAMSDPPVIERIMDAIDNNKPFIEDEVPDGVLS